MWPAGIMHLYTPQIGAEQHNKVANILVNAVEHSRVDVGNRHIPILKHASHVLQMRLSLFWHFHFGEVLPKQVHFLLEVTMLKLLLCDPLSVLFDEVRTTFGCQPNTVDHFDTLNLVSTTLQPKHGSRRPSPEARLKVRDLVQGFP